jgi:hypothetical protein
MKVHNKNYRGTCYTSSKNNHCRSECPDNSTGDNFARVESPVAFPVVMGVTVTHARPFPGARIMFMNDGETWM